MLRRSSSSRDPACDAFTLIELLTVIAIIGILAGIMIPVLGKVRETTKRSACASNLRQIGIALKLHQTEFGKFPRQPGSTLGGSNNTSDGLASLHRLGYIATPATFFCPSDRGNKVPVKIGNNTQQHAESAQISYLYMYRHYLPALGGDNKDDNGPNQLDAAGGIDTPSRKTLVEDLYGGALTNTLEGNHSPQGGNVLFADGHVHWEPSPWNAEKWGNVWREPADR